MGIHDDGGGVCGVGNAEQGTRHHGGWGVCGV